MSTSMPTSLIGSALLPVILVILLGFAIRRIGLVGDAHVAGIERVTYMVFFPALIISSLSTASFEDSSVWVLAGLLCALIAGFAFASWAFYVRTSLDRLSMTSAFQGSIRFNSYILLALVLAIYGQTGVQQIMVPLALMIIVVNVFCVAMLARHGQAPQGTMPPPMWKSFATNPLIVASVVGLALNPFQINWPGPVDQVFDWFSTAAIALGLFAVGAGLTPISGKGSVFAIASSSLIKLIVLPLVFLAVSLTLGLPHDLIGLGLMATMMPGATSSYILARQMGGNAPLMAQILTVSTLGSALTVTGWFFVWPFVP